MLLITNVKYRLAILNQVLIAMALTPIYYMCAREYHTLY
jgi:hypothetical protein